MDQAYKFEELINSYLGRPTYVTYSENWNTKNERTALLFTACILEYDKNSTEENGDKLQYFMEELFNKENNMKISIECYQFLKSLRDK